jgi:DUF4097 and DUF4098 domain-containing protein YvlB
MRNIMNRKSSGSRVATVILATTLATFSAGVVPCLAQVVPTPPAPPSPPSSEAPVAPRPPRAPRASHWFGDEGVARIDTTVSFSSSGTVDLSLVSGTIHVSTWARNQVRVVASTSGEPSLEFDASSSHLSLEQSRNGRGRGDVGSANYDVTVPTGVRATLSSVSGSIDASGVRGPVEVSTVSGSARLRDLGSTLNVEGVSGDITITNVASDARVENVSGRISLTGIGGSASAETVSGSIVVAGVRGDRVHATSVSGDLDFAGAVSPTGRYDLETHSGTTRVRLASNANVAISVETFSGSVSNDYPGATRRRNSDSDDDGTNYEYVIGRGSGRLHIETFSGSVHISQGNQ